MMGNLYVKRELERDNDGEFKMDEAIRELIFMSEVKVDAN